MSSTLPDQAPPPPLIRPLTLSHDRAAVFALIAASAEYVAMERDEPPHPGLVDEYFTDAPPGLDPANGHRAGLFDGTRLLGLAEMSFGYPTAGDAYLGLMMVHPDARGRGVGPRLLRHLEAVARQRSAAQMLLAVLDANPRGRAFWEREGFRATGLSGSVTLGQKTQGVQRFAKPL